MKNTTKAVIGVLIIAFILAAGLFFRDRMPRGGEEADGGISIERTEPGIESLSVEDGNIVMRGAGLARAELWYVPTGTGVTEADHAKVGDMASAESSIRGLEEWRYPLPSTSFSAAEVYAKAFGEDGTEFRSSFGATGATEIYDALWGNPPQTDHQLDPGESMTLGAFTLTVHSFVSDSRCAPDVQCVSAGSVQAEVSAAAFGETETRTITSETPAVFGDYRVTMTEVRPRVPDSGTAPDFAEYSALFEIEQIIR